MNRTFPSKIYLIFFLDTANLEFNPCSFTTEFFFEHGFIGLTADAWSWGGTVFQTAVTVCCINPETSSRVTLASLGIGFQPKLVTIISC